MIDDYADRWALVTGASSGIGAEFARILAARGMHLVLCARRQNRLEELAADLHTRHGTVCDIIPADLSEPDEVVRLIEEIENRKRQIDLVVNNAGFAVVADIPHTNVDSVDRMIRLNVGAVTKLTYHFLPDMLQRRQGAMINVSSVVGLQPVAYMPAYAASKAYVLHFTEALWAELRGSGVSVMALCPGATRTEFFEVAGVKGWLKKQRSHSPGYVVRKALKALDKRKPFKLIGLWNFLRSLLVRMAPRKRVVIETLKYFRPRKTQRNDNNGTTDESQQSQEPQSVS